MFKKLALVTLILSGLSVSAQNIPTIYSYTVDTLCDGDWNKKFLTVTIEDLDGDSTYIGVVTNNDTYMSSSFTVVDPPYSSGATLRTFQIYGDAGFAMTAEIVNLASVNLEITGNLANDGVEGDEDINDVPVYGYLTATIDFGTTTFCTTDNPVDLTPYVTPMGGVFDHGNYPLFENGFSPLNFFLDSGDGLGYVYTNAAGCEAYTTDWPTVYESPNISITPQNSTCGNADGSADALIIGQTAPPFDVYWTNGFTEMASSISSVSGLSSGVYYVYVTDGNGCTSQAPAQISDANVNVASVITDPTCAGDLTGAIDLAVTGDIVDSYFWATGQTTEDISGLAEGEYTVAIYTTGNCQAFKTYYVNDPAPIEVSFDAINGEDCTGSPDQSYINITTSGGSGSYTWNWDSGTNNLENFTDPGVGLHTCIITDAIDGCTHEFDVLIEDFGAPFVWVNELTKPECNQSNGAIDLGVAVNNAPITSIVWSNGPTTEDISGLLEGTYTVTVTDDNGCYTQQVAKLTNKKPTATSICLLTVDTSYIYNQVVWEKDVSQTVSGFNVYRETQAQGGFEKVAQRPYALESFFMDNAASPMDRSWRYYITSYDACGNESVPSFIHKTIHTVAVPVGINDMKVSWDNYEGISYSSVDIHRFDATNGWVTIESNYTGTSPYTDTPPVLLGLDYMISFNLSATCTSTKAQDYNSSRSNKSSGAWDPGQSTTSIEDEDLGQISVYPNPTNGMLNIYIEQPEQFEMIEVRNLNGQLIFTSNVQSNSSIDMSDFSNGIYYVRLVSGIKTINHKIVKT